MNFQELNEAFNRLKAAGYHFSIYNADRYTSVTLSKHTVGSTRLEVVGESNGDLKEAFEKALANFPQNPLDGSKWANNRLAAPTDVVEGKFTETQP